MGVGAEAEAGRGLKLALQDSNPRPRLPLYLNALSFHCKLNKHIHFIINLTLWSKQCSLH